MGAVLMGNSVGIGVGSLEEGDKVGAVLTGNSVGIGVSCQNPTNMRNRHG